MNGSHDHFDDLKHTGHTLEQLCVLFKISKQAMTNRPNRHKHSNCEQHSDWRVPKVISIFIIYISTIFLWVCVFHVQYITNTKRVFSMCIVHCGENGYGNVCATLNKWIYHLKVKFEVYLLYTNIWNWKKEQKLSLDKS